MVPQREFPVPRMINYPASEAFLLLSKVPVDSKLFPMNVFSPVWASWFAPLSLMVLLGLGLSSCSPSQAEIRQIYSQLNYHVDPSQARAREGLSLFVHLENEDGLEDVEEIQILNNQDELFWSLGESNWSRAERNRETWFGSNALFLPRLEGLPRGNYRIRVVTRSGAVSRGLFNIDSPILEEYRQGFPRVQVQGNQVTVNPSPGSFLVWFHNANGEVLVSHRATGTQLQLNEILPQAADRNRVVSFSLYYYLEDRGVGVILGPYIWEPGS